MPCTGPVQQEVLAQILRQRTASEYRKTHRGRSPCGPSAQAREPRRGLIKINKAPARGADQTAPPDNAPRRGEARKRRSPCGTCSPHDAGRGPYAPQRRSGRQRRRNLPKTQKGPQGDSPCGPLPALPARLRASPRARRRASIEKRPPRARRPALPQPCAAVLSAKAGLTAGFGMGPGDPRLCGRARGGRSPAAQMYSSLPGPLTGATLAAAWRARMKIAHRARCFNRGCEELGLLVPLG